MVAVTKDGISRLRVFLCHGTEDQAAVRDLYRRLSSLKQLDLWLAEIKLLPGHDTEREITKAIRASHVVIVCLSNKSVNEEGPAQKQQWWACEIAKEKSEGTIFLIPALFEECEVPSQLRAHHWAKLFEENGYARLVAALQARALRFGISIEEPTDVCTEHAKPRKPPVVNYDGIAKDVLAQIERIRSIPDRSRQLAEARLAAAEFQRRIDPAALEMGARDVSRLLATTVYPRLSVENIAVLGTTPEAYLPGVATRVAEEESLLVLNSMKFMTAFDNALRAESPISEVLATMASGRGM